MKPNDSVFPQSPGPSAIARKMATFVSLLLGGVVGAAEKPQPMPLPPVTVRHKDGEYGAEKWAWEGSASVKDAGKVTARAATRFDGIIRQPAQIWPRTMRAVSVLFRTPLASFIFHSGPG